MEQRRISMQERLVPGLVSGITSLVGLVRLGLDHVYLC